MGGARGGSNFKLKFNLNLEVQLEVQLEAPPRRRGGRERHKMSAPPRLYVGRHFGCLKDWNSLVYGFLASGFLSVLLFSRSLYPCLLGAVGLLVSLETIAAVDRGDQAVGLLTFYGLYMLINVIASLALGVVLLTNLDAECASQENPSTCSSVGSVTGLIVSVGSSTLGVFALLASLLPVCAMRCCTARETGGGGGDGGAASGAALLRSREKLALELAANKLGG